DPSKYRHDQPSRTLGVWVVETSSVAAVIVTYNTPAVLSRAVDALLGSSQPPSHVVIVDNGSTDTAALDAVEGRHSSIVVLRQDHNLGFCGANNVGHQALPPTRYVLFVNPDAVVDADFLEGAVAYLDSHPNVGAVNPKLLTLDPVTLEPTGTIDCAGIFQTRWGRVYDRGQGEVDRGQFDGDPENVPGLCGAALLARTAALDDVAVNGQVFDERFFMYKEDLDLSYRLAAAGWRTVLLPHLDVFHCRGSRQVNRASIAPWVRRRSLANEWRLWRKGSVPAPLRARMFAYLIVKSVAVALGR
ncbi:MAG: glycosyltransferase family 2 protein, partial [Acidimicrobiales bacterium]